MLLQGFGYLGADLDFPDAVVFGSLGYRLFARRHYLLANGDLVAVHVAPAERAEFAAAHSESQRKIEGHPSRIADGERGNRSIYRRLVSRPRLRRWADR